MDAILYYDRVFKKVPAFHDIFESKFNLFKARSAKRYQIGNDHLILMQEIKDILLEHKKSPVEFTRRDKFVICSDKYVMRTISLEEMGGYINKAKLFIQAVDTITTENERIFR